MFITLTASCTENFNLTAFCTENFNAKFFIFTTKTCRTTQQTYTQEIVSHIKYRYPVFRDHEAAETKNSRTFQKLLRIIIILQR